MFAESSEEAERLAREFEPADVRDELTTEVVSLLPGETSTRKGVDWSSGLIFYPNET